MTCVFSTAGRLNYRCSSATEGHVVIRSIRLPHLRIRPEALLYVKQIILIITTITHILIRMIFSYRAHCLYESDTIHYTDNNYYTV